MSVNASILDSCKANDRRAQRELYEHCFHLLMPMCYSYTKNEEDARALLNGGFLKILKSLSKFRADSSFDSWARRIMKNEIIDEYRKARNHKELIAGKETDRELEVNGRVALNDAGSDMEVEYIRGLVNRLPKMTQRVFQLYVIEGYNHGEIGEILDISDGTSKWHLSQARKTLREWIERDSEMDQLRIEISA